MPDKSKEIKNTTKTLQKQARSHFLCTSAAWLRVSQTATADFLNSCDIWKNGSCGINFHFSVEFGLNFNLFLTNDHFHFHD